MDGFMVSPLFYPHKTNYIYAINLIYLINFRQIFVLWYLRMHYNSSIRMYASVLLPGKKVSNFT
jgi:hypothetical protein